jgi:arylsulfatase A-like enzyme
MDWATGEILNALDRLHLAENTLVIVSSDNGPVFFDGYFDRSVEDANGHRPGGDLRGWKYLVFEASCRVPLIARWPARIQPRVSDQMFGLVDLFATLANVSGGKVPKTAARDSLDLSAVLLGRTRKDLRDHTILHGLSDTLAICQGNWKYIPANAKAQTSGMGRGANPSDARFAESRITEPLLFNLANDPGERTNVISQNPKVAETLKKRLIKITGKESQEGSL